MGLNQTFELVERLTRKANPSTNTGTFTEPEATGYLVGRDNDLTYKDVATEMPGRTADLAAIRGGNFVEKIDYQSLLKTYMRSVIEQTGSSMLLKPVGIGTGGMIVLRQIADEVVQERQALRGEGSAPLVYSDVVKGFQAGDKVCMKPTDLGTVKETVRSRGGVRFVRVEWPDNYQTIEQESALIKA